MNRKTRKFLIWFTLLPILLIGYFIVDSILFDGIKPRQISENGFQGQFFSLENIKNKPAVVLIGGGKWGHYWGVEFAKKGYVGLSLPYHRKAGLPSLMEEIPLEYFENAIVWLKNQPEVNSNKIILMGASRNAELSLTVAATFPNLVHGVIAYAPSSVSWSNTVLPFNSDNIKPSWTYKNQPIPYISMEKIKGSNYSKIETLEYWEKGLSDIEQVAQAQIKVEQINGPILLFSGKDDKVWPSSLMSNMIETRLKEYNFNYDFKNIQYENAGHLISGNPHSPSNQRTGQMPINGKTYEFQYGGTAEGDQQAQLDARGKVFEFVSSL